MHIVIDARIINSSTGRYVERLVHYLEEIDRKNKYTVLVPKKDIHFWRPTHSNFSVKVADFDNYSFQEQLGFKTLLDSLSPDLVHFCMPQQPVLYTGKKVTTFHDLILLQTYNSDKNWLVFHAKQVVGRFVFKRVARSSDAIIVPTQYVKDDLIAYTGISSEKVTRTYEAAEASTESLERYPLDFKQFLVYVGQQSDYKNIRRLGDAHAQLVKKHPHLGLVLVGKRGADSVENEAYFTQKGYKNIHFTGFIPDSQKNWLLANCATYVFPSLMEGFGLPGLEAMVAGSPVTSSNATCLPEVYGDAAEYFDPRDIKDMARVIDSVISDEATRETMIKNGYKQAKKYSWKRMATQTLAVYEQAVKK